MIPVSRPLGKYSFFKKCRLDSSSVSSSLATPANKYPSIPSKSRRTSMWPLQLVEMLLATLRRSSHLEDFLPQELLLENSSGPLYCYSLRQAGVSCFEK